MTLTGLIPEDQSTLDYEPEISNIPNGENIDTYAMSCTPI
jgi:hypothetical protein